MASILGRKRDRSSAVPRREKEKKSVQRKVVFNKVTAGLWAVAGVAVFFLGWQESVAFVIVASVYANVKADWSTAEASDDRNVTRRLDEMQRLMERLEGGCDHCRSATCRES